MNLLLVLRILPYLLTLFFFFNYFWVCDVWSEGQSEEEIEKIAAQEQKVFAFETLVAATKDFHPSQKLGEGGFGPVYKVWISAFSESDLVLIVWLLRKFGWNRLFIFPSSSFDFSPQKKNPEIVSQLNSYPCVVRNIVLEVYSLEIEPAMAIG